MIALAFAPAARSEEPLPTPPAQSLSLIAWTPKGWVIDIEKDGSGVPRYGLGEVEPATFPAGTVSFSQVLEWAETRSEVARGNPECVVAVIDRSLPDGKEDLSEKSRAMSGDLATLARQILPHLQSRDVDMACMPKISVCFGVVPREWESVGEKILLNLAAHDEKRLAMLLTKYPLVKNPEVRPRFYEPAETTERPQRPRNKH
ncbi:hypothetical protein [Haloferula sp. BvORR071]|uniref:hypothetical protein n=1 Tax=Haloferula sp. BvORR071 TaxID=1396141 RepID=UPI002240F2BF|nr:hypothetical protein [Haloferula sp. BvORR071]